MFSKLSAAFLAHLITKCSRWSIWIKLCLLPCIIPHVSSLIYHPVVVNNFYKVTSPLKPMGWLQPNYTGMSLLKNCVCCFIRKGKKDNTFKFFTSETASLISSWFSRIVPWVTLFQNIFQFLIYWNIWGGIIKGIKRQN